MLQLYAIVCDNYTLLYVVQYAHAVSLSCWFVILTRGSYKDRFALLAESMEREKQDVGIRDKAQTKVTCRSFLQ